MARNYTVKHHPLYARIARAMQQAGLSEQDLALMSAAKAATLFDSKDFGFTQAPGEFNDTVMMTARPMRYSSVFRFACLLDIPLFELALSESEETRYLAITTGQGDSRRFLRKDAELLESKRRRQPLWEKQWLFTYPHNGDGKALLNAYRELKTYYLAAKHCIHAREVLLPGSFNKPGADTIYKIAQKELHKAIEATLIRHQQAGNYRFSYRRTFYLSPNKRFFSKNDHDNRLQAFVSEATVATLRHLIICARVAPKLCAFDLIADNSSLREYVNIDEEYLLTEDYNIKSDRVNPECITLYNTRSGLAASLLRFTQQAESARQQSQTLDTWDTEAITDAVLRAQRYAMHQAVQRGRAVKSFGSEVYGTLYTRTNETADQFGHLAEALEDKLTRLNNFIDKELHRF